MNPVRASQYFVYVIRSLTSGDFYTGCTNDLKKRLTEHAKGLSSYTSKRGPYNLIYYEYCINSKDAYRREKYLKSGQGKRFLKNRLKTYLEGLSDESR